MMSDVALSRKEVADKLKAATASYWLRKGYSTYHELGLSKWGKLRGDMVALNMRRDLVVCEVKSCKADLDSDKKLLNYLPLCNRLYLVVSAPTWEAVREKWAPIFKANGIGVMVLSPKSGWLEVKSNAKHRDIEFAYKRDLIVRMAFRHGIHRGNSRRQRQFLDKGN